MVKFRLLLIYLVFQKSYVNYYAYRMSSYTGQYGPADAAGEFDEVILTQTQSPDHFSSLLWMPNDQHRVSLISENVSYSINFVVHFISILFN